MRQDFFLARTCRNLDDLNVQCDGCCEGIINPHVQANNRRFLNEAFVEERPSLSAIPATPYSAALTVERRARHEGMTSVDGNLCSVPDKTRRRVVDVQKTSTRTASSRTAIWLADTPC